MSETVQFDKQHWHYLTDLSQDRGKTLLEKYQLPKKFLKYTRDVKERARLEYDADSGFWLLIFRIIHHDNKLGYGTVPIAFICDDTDLFAIQLHGGQDMAQIKAAVLKLIEEETTSSTLSVLYQLLTLLTEQFFDAIDAINDRRTKLENRKGRPTNKAINQLTELGKSLVYLTTATNNNLVAVRQFKLSAEGKDQLIELKDFERSHLKDAIIELEQAQDMAQLATDVIDRVSNAYNNILNNNLNETMRFLTVWSIVLAIPPIISGFYGMNVKLPLAKQPFSWLFTIILSLAGVGIMIWHLYRRRDL
ncbi:magnesium transporter CorA family protein [Lactobacillus sp. CC-MHH1034]|uniref:magnesium transporter CorA family protein n=1 Tax=Agrilactobacillus fermenti TaxID=2586909 RepID=UPI001E2B0D57|nr:magnesium transporter CorA family protein [Agrilactobacillus fermenti]MCD2256720.1 magnesium transporter CorA family protein [Agrilactobacillus fermenti]